MGKRGRCSYGKRHTQEGLDFRHEFSSRTWVVQATAVGSRISGDPSAITATQQLGNHFFQRPDADHLEVDANATTMTGYSIGASIGKQAGTHWLGSFELAATNPQYEVNDLGFQTRTDRRDAALNVPVCGEPTGLLLAQLQHRRRRPL